jgi:hypothetical protein
MGVGKRFVPPVITQFERYSYETSQPFQHSLKNFIQEWWDKSSDERRDFLTNYWKSRMVPSDRTLRQTGDRLFITNRNKRVLVSTARERDDGKFFYRLPHKSYEVIVLLAWENSEEAVLRAFVIPQKVYRDQWTKIPKGERDVELVLNREGGVYVLNLAGSRIEVSAFEGDYHPLA